MIITRSPLRITLGEAVLICRLITLNLRFFSYLRYRQYVYVTVLRPFSRAFS